ncbi:MAG TPA: glycosyltransferase family 9 protein [Caulobacteraceae bacterium]|jgi:ADP-heptose:LPS heptosyltransferase
MNGHVLAGYDRVLVIKLGALGDFVQALRAMEEIRRAHPKASITLLTTPLFADLAQATGWFDAIDTGGRPKGPGEMLGLYARLRGGRYQRVYDLQTSSRSAGYIWAFAPAFPEWSGISPGASHRHRNPRRDLMQNLDRLWDQLAEAGVVEPLPEGQAPGPDLAWAIAASDRERPPLGERLGIRGPFALLAPGASPGRPRKRWPVQSFADLAKALEQTGITPVMIGGPQEAELGAEIAKAAPATIIAAARTSLVDLAALGARAALLVGNDTGPVYLAAFAGAPTLILFSADSDPALCAPCSGRITVMRSDDLADLPATQVIKASRVLLGGA